MKKLINVLASLKMMTIFVFCGMMFFYLAGNAIIYQKFQVNTLDIIWLIAMSVVVAGLKIGADYKVERGWLNNKVAVVLLGIAVVGVMFLGNFLFKLFPLVGIGYLYFGLIMSFLYAGGVFGFWIVEKFEIKSLNACLNTFKKTA